MRKKWEILERNMYRDISFVTKLEYFFRHHYFVSHYFSRKKTDVSILKVKLISYFTAIEFQEW